MNILLVKRSNEVSMPGVWAAPGGGVEPDETEPEAVFREGDEELGGLPEDLWLEEEPSRWDSPYVCFATFLGTTSDVRWKPHLNWENSEWKWFNPRRLPRPIMPGTQKAVEDLLG
jgi:8-oxo-dGTP pyrophosphatase MutT (NUDIX family)